MLGWDGGNRAARTGRVARPDGARTRPAGLCRGAGHIVDYGNPAFLAAFGERAIGLPARESMLGLPIEAFLLLDAVYRRGRPLARWVRLDDDDWRLTALPRVDPETQEVYGVAFHLRAGSDLPVVLGA
jgi:hypothetical protein